MAEMSANGQPRAGGPAAERAPAQHWDTPNHGEAGPFIAQTRHATGQPVVGKDPALITAAAEHFEASDRRRLSDAADALLEALENARHSHELYHIRGDLAQL